MPKAIVAHKTGGPEVLSFEDIEVGAPKAGQVRIAHNAIGVNFIDTYYRSGLYPWKDPYPIIAGAEGSGYVLAVGEDVDDFKKGDRIAYTTSHGAYAEQRLMPADRLVKLPDEIDDVTAAAVMLKGLTVQYLLFRTFQVKPRQKILFHAAAGGVGLLAGQWASHLGATLIGTVSTPEKAKLAKENGYHHVINYKEENFVERVKEITHGEGVDVVYDSVGQTTYPQSLHCLKRLGMWVCFGQSSGVIKNFELQQLAQNGSLFATRPSLFNYIYTKEELQKAAEHLFEALENGILKVSVNQQFALKEARKAHEMLESRKTTGSTVLLP